LGLRLSSRFTSAVLTNSQTGAIEAGELIDTKMAAQALGVSVSMVALRQELWGRLWGTGAARY
jgi:hypothetical protein